MDNKRFLDTKAVSFESGKVVPIWLCGYKNDENYGSKFLFEDEISNNIIDATWDIKKKELVPVFLVDQEAMQVFSVGEMVAYEKGHSFIAGHGIKSTRVEKIESIRKERDAVYYEKINEKNLRVEKVVAENTIPEGTKLIGFVTYKYYYSFYYDEKEYGEFYVSKIV
jgi:hypothetical protein